VVDYLIIINLKTTERALIATRWVHKTTFGVFVTTHWVPKATDRVKSYRSGYIAHNNILWIELQEF